MPLKGIVHPLMNILSFTHTHSVPNLYDVPDVPGTQKDDLGELYSKSFFPGEIKVKSFKKDEKVAYHKSGR